MAPATRFDNTPYAGETGPAVVLITGAPGTGKSTVGRLLAAQLIGYAAARCLAIEDAPAGITAATRAGCHTLGVLTTYPHLDGDTVPDLSAVAVRPTRQGLTISY